MTKKEKIKQLKALVEEAKEIAHKIGVKGEFCCPSCRQTKSNVGAMDPEAMMANRVATRPPHYNHHEAACRDLERLARDLRQRS